MTKRAKNQLSRQRRKALQRKHFIILGGALLAVVLVALAVVRLTRGAEDRPVSTAVVEITAAPRETPEPASETEIAEPTDAEAEVGSEAEAEADAPETEYVPETATPEPEPTPAPAAASVPDDAQAASRALTRPTPTAEGFLPIFMKADTQEKIIAITVDDCFQAENLAQIVQAAMDADAKLTIFPIGLNALKDKQSEILKRAWENGFELENHTYSHNGLYKCDDDKLMEEVTRQQLALSYILGVEYHCHFLRPRGGDARRDQRIQKAAEQMGYYGIAHWSASGAADDEKIASRLEPGAIYLFHTTDKDREKLLRFIPWVASKGYKMVTLNEMFGYPANETSPLKGSIEDYPIPTLAPFERVLVPYKKTSYSNGVLLLQQKLIDLGYLTGKADGVYGDGCVNAIKKYQQEHGLEATGVADVQTQEMIFAEQAVAGGNG